MVILWLLCCILSKFYIKPQQRIRHKIGHSCCILSKFYIKPQLVPCGKCEDCRCILSKFYIKPQLAGRLTEARQVVSYRNSTSNHNKISCRLFFNWLYLIEILHQTTTTFGAIPLLFRLYLIEILHQTTTLSSVLLGPSGCILSKFYIKPQPVANDHPRATVVSYRNSTSNHNFTGCATFQDRVVSYRNSTSNHNLACTLAASFGVVSYRNSTSNHNPYADLRKRRGVVSYRNSTSNHNLLREFVNR